MALKKVSINSTGAKCLNLKQFFSENDIKVLEFWKKKIISQMKIIEGSFKFLALTKFINIYQHIFVLSQSSGIVERVLSQVYFY